jgi:hypothetical protein
LRELNHGFDRTERPPNFSSELPRTYRPRPPAGAVARNVAFADSGIEVSGKPVETARSTATRSMAVPMQHVILRCDRRVVWPVSHALSTSEKKKRWIVAPSPICGQQIG